MSVCREPELVGCGSDGPSSDDQYLSELNATDNPFVSDGRAIDFGQTVCEQVDNGETIGTLALGMNGKLAATAE